MDKKLSTLTIPNDYAIADEAVALYQAFSQTKAEKYSVVQRLIMESFACWQKKDFAGGIKALESAWTLKKLPSIAAGMCSLLNAADNPQREFVAAHTWINRAIELERNNKRLSDHWVQKATVCLNERMWAACAAALMKAKTAWFDNFKAWVIDGMLGLEENYPALAENALRRALQLKPDNPEAHLSLAYALFMLGRWEEGWEHYEYRFLTHAMRGYRQFAPKWKLWRGESLVGKSIYLRCEQGHGDTFWMLRYVDHVRNLYGDESTMIVIGCYPEMIRLLNIMMADCLIVDINAKDFKIRDALYTGGKDPDYWCWLMSVPQFFKGGLPTATPYIVAPKLFTFEERFRLGVCWHGNKDQGDDWKRSINEDLFKTVVGPNYDGDKTRVEIVSLQFNERYDERDHTFAKGDWLDTAMLISSCNAVLTVDTSIAHLAGAMGVPTIVLLSASPAFHYPRQGEHMPWYGSQRLVRQKTLGNWEEPLKEACDFLDVMVQEWRQLAINL